jgi:two-component system response regulator RegA
MSIVPDGRLRLLLIDDDPTFSEVLGRALTRRGFEVLRAESAEAGIDAAQRDPPEYAVVDLKLPGASGLVAVARLRALSQTMRILVLTGYASIATAVEAIKLGATNYLAKPADADDIVSALSPTLSRDSDPVEARPLSVHQLEWEHIHKVLHEHAGNISETARVLKLHRRTLQRKLAKRPSRG